MCTVPWYRCDLTCLCSRAGRHYDDLHSDMVRGLAWAPDSDTLYSCGWDKAVLSRSVG